MSKLQNLEFAALKVSGENYLKWALDIKILLKSRGIGKTIEEIPPNGPKPPEKSMYQAALAIRHHLEEPLKDQYIDVEDPLVIWLELKARYDHQRTVLLPQAQFDWQHLRIQDFKSVEEYNSALFKIVAILRMCGEPVSEKDLLEKTLSTFHIGNVVLQQQYRNQKFEKYSELIACLLLAEKNSELLMINSAMGPPGAKPLPETHKAEANKTEAKQEATEAAHGHRDGRGRNKRSGPRNTRGKRRGNRGYNAARGNYQPNHERSGQRDRSNYNRGLGQTRGIQKPTRGVCNRCGMTGHWERSCRTSRHLADLYQQYGKRAEANATFQESEGEFKQDEFKQDDDDLLYETADILKEDKQ